MSAILLQAAQVVSAQGVQVEDEGGDSGRSRVNKEKRAILEAEGTAEAEYEKSVTQRDAYTTGFELGKAEAANAKVVITGSHERQTPVSKIACTFGDPRAQVVTDNGKMNVKPTRMTVHSNAFPFCKATVVAEPRTVFVEESDPLVLEGLLVYFFSPEDLDFFTGIVDGWSAGATYSEFSPANEAFIRSLQL